MMHILNFDTELDSSSERRPLESYWVKMVGSVFTMHDMEVSQLENPASFDSLRKVIVKCEIWGGQVECIAHLSSQFIDKASLKTYTRNEVMSLEAFKSINNKA